MGQGYAVRTVLLYLIHKSMKKDQMLSHKLKATFAAYHPANKTPRNAVRRHPLSVDSETVAVSLGPIQITSMKIITYRLGSLWLTMEMTFLLSSAFERCVS